jgi:hypothetical protein
MTAGQASALFFARYQGLRLVRRTGDPCSGELGQCRILARLSRPPYRWYAWVNNFADAPNANVAELISSAKEPS